MNTFPVYTDVSSKGILKDALCNVDRISDDLKMADDMQWELLDKHLTRYLGIYYQSNLEAKLAMIDSIYSTQSVVRALCNFVSMLIECE